MSKVEGYSNLFQQLVQDGVLALDENGKRRFTKDHACSSPSAAAAVVTGRNANGRKEWTIKGTKKSYSDWQDEIISQQNGETEQGKA